MLGFVYPMFPGFKAEGTHQIPIIFIVTLICTVLITIMFYCPICFLKYHR